jgi:hypothetical protein
LRHLTPAEIALNQQELTCFAEIELLETQEQSLELELEQDIDEKRRMMVVQNLRVVYREPLDRMDETEVDQNYQDRSLSLVAARS